MSRATPNALVIACICLALTACGGGQDAQLIAKAAASKEATPAVVEESADKLVTASAVTPTEQLVWEARAALSRAEVEQALSTPTGKGAVSGATSVSAVAMTKAAISAPSAAIYRFFNIQTGAHLFTKTLSERDTVLNTLAQFRYEGPVFSAWNSPAAGLSPVYRFYNTRSGAHFYTISEAEKSHILATAPWMNLDGVAYYASPTAQAGTTPLYRFYHLQQGFHFYTASASESQSIQANLSGTYKYEGVGYHVNSAIGSFDRALASFAGKVNTDGYLNGLGESARFRSLRGMAFHPAGDLFVVDMKNDSGYFPELRRISSAGLVTSFIGNQSSTIYYADGVGSGAAMSDMKSVTFDAAGMGYVGDGQTVRSVTPAGLVTTIAGGFAGRGYVNGQAQAARFNFIVGIAKDSVGNIYISDRNNHVIRKIATTGVVSTFAGADSTQSNRAGYADGVGTAARFYYPGQIAVDAGDNLYVADQYNNRIRKITPAGLVTTLAGQASSGVLDGQGTATQFAYPYALAVDTSKGDVYVADYDGFTVRRITPSGIVTTVVGTANSPGVFFGSLPAGMDSVGGMAVRAGRLYIASNHGVYWTNLPE